MYTDVDYRWNFNEDGDLRLTNNYRQSIKLRVLCPLNYLNIYYDNYGSELHKQLGEKYNEEIIIDELHKTLKQDTNIINYSIDNLVFENGDLTIYLTVNGEPIFFYYNLYLEDEKILSLKTDEVEVNASIYDDVINLIITVNGIEKNYIKYLKEELDIDFVEAILYNYYYLDGKVYVEVLLDYIKYVLIYDINGDVVI